MARRQRLAGVAPAPALRGSWIRRLPGLPRSFPDLGKEPAPLGEARQPRPLGGLCARQASSFCPTPSSVRRRKEPRFGVLSADLGTVAAQGATAARFPLASRKRAGRGSAQALEESQPFPLRLAGLPTALGISQGGWSSGSLGAGAPHGEFRLCHTDGMAAGTQESGGRGPRNLVSPRRTQRPGKRRWSDGWRGARSTVGPPVPSPTAPSGQKPRAGAGEP